MFIYMYLHGKHQNQPKVILVVYMTLESLMVNITGG